MSFVNMGIWALCPAMPGLIHVPRGPRQSSSHPPGTLRWPGTHLAEVAILVELGILLVNTYFFNHSE